MALDTIGTYKRSKPRLAVLRGWDINNPSNIAPRAASAEDQGTILSGHLISKNGDGEWIKGVNSTQPATIAFAVQDDVDFDVVGSGVITGLSVLGKYEIQTPFFKSDDTYTVGLPLTYDGTTGNIKITTLESGAPIIGYVSGGKVDVAATNSNVEQSAGHAYVVQFVTNYAANTADAT
jgi:hypothetical protein